MAPQISLQRRLKSVTPPVCTPISYRDWKTTLKIDANMSNPDVQRRIKAGTRLVENHMRKAIVAQVWDMFVDDAHNTWPGIFQSLYPQAILSGYSIELAKPPLLFVNGVYTRAESGFEVAVDPATYWVSEESNPGRISLKDGNTWPYHRGFEGFRVRLTAGYVYPFKCSAGILTTFPQHGYQAGETVRVQAGHSDVLPTSLEEDTDYVVTNVSGNSFQLLDATGSLIQPSDSDDYHFVGTETIPETVRRAIVLTSAIEIGTDVPNKVAGQGRFAPVTLPVTAADLLEDEVFYSI